MTRLLLALSLCVSTSAWAETFKLTSSVLKPGGKIAMEQVFDSFGCEGKNVSPDLSWSGAPKDTKFFALTMYDPDAPTGSGWWHWVVLNIPAETTSLPAGAGSGGDMPKGSLQTRTDFGKPGYGGPCPPPGKPHRYIFTIHALKQKIEGVDEDASGAMAGFYINANTIGKAKLAAKFGR
jgi:Raf kinase inhibitor-like YbhB/YbcL family protein